MSPTTCAVTQSGGRSAAPSQTRSESRPAPGRPELFQLHRSTPLGARCERVSPARLLVEDAEHRLADQLVGQRVVAGMEPATAHVAVEALQLVADHHAGAAGDVEGPV